MYESRCNTVNLTGRTTDSEHTDRTGPNPYPTSPNRSTLWHVKKICVLYGNPSSPCDPVWR